MNFKDHYYCTCYDTWDCPMCIYECEGCAEARDDIEFVESCKRNLGEAKEA